MLLDVSIRVSLVALSVEIILRCARVRASSTVRHAAWTAVLGAMLLMPLLPHIVPAIPVPSRVASSAFDALPDVSSQEGTARTEDRPAPDAAAEISRPLAASTQAVGMVSPVRTAWVMWPVAAIAVYLLGAFLLSTRLLIGFAAVRQIKRSARLADGFGPASWPAIYQSTLVATRRPTAASSGTAANSLA